MTECVTALSTSFLGEYEIAKLQAGHSTNVNQCPLTKAFSIFSDIFGTLSCINRKKVNWSDESRSFLNNVDDRVQMLGQPREVMATCYTVGKDISPKNGKLNKKHLLLRIK